MPGHRTALHHYLADHYNLDDLKTLCFFLNDQDEILNLNYENLAGDTLDAKARELILWFERRDQLDRLLAYLDQDRPGLLRRAGLSTHVGDLLFHAYEQQTGQLRHHILVHAFKTLVARRIQNFVGRDFIFRDIQRYIADPAFPSGYIFIIGEPGIGKTSVAAQLVYTKGYIHHFNIASDDIRSTHDFLANICAQLIVQFDLPYTRLPEHATRHSGFLSQLLDEAAAQAAGSPLILLVDALDEAEPPSQPNQNRLDLPRYLPPNVYIIVTTRPQIPLAVDRRKRIELDPDDPQNRANVRQYIDNYLDQHGEQMTRRLEEWQTTRPAFVTTLLGKSKGNFMYLVHVLDDIRDGRLTAANIDNINNLPVGLRDYYNTHWRIMRNADRQAFGAYYEPVVSFLAAAQEPVNLTKIAAWTRLRPYQLHEVLDAWREFLHIEETNQGPLYRIYHASFRDFLDHKVNLPAYHSNISQNALDNLPQWTQ